MFTQRAVHTRQHRTGVSHSSPAVIHSSSSFARLISNTLVGSPNTSAVLLDAPAGSSRPRSGTRCSCMWKTLVEARQPRRSSPPEPEAWSMNATHPPRPHVARARRRRWSGAQRRPGVVVVAELAPPRPEPITFLAFRGATANGTRTVLQLDRRVRLRLEVQPPCRLRLRPAIHGQGDQVRPVLEVADDRDPWLAGSSPDAS